MWLKYKMGCGRSKNTNPDNYAGSSSNLQEQEGSGMKQENTTKANSVRHEANSASKKQEAFSKKQNNSKSDKTGTLANVNGIKKKDDFSNCLTKSMDSVTVKDVNKNNSTGLSTVGKTGPLSSGSRITDSQIEFFRLLDEKIEQGRVTEVS